VCIRLEQSGWTSEAESAGRLIIECGVCLEPVEDLFDWCPGNAGYGVRIGTDSPRTLMQSATVDALRAKAVVVTASSLGWARQAAAHSIGGLR
jgi:hypothetical protein